MMSARSEYRKKIPPPLTLPGRDTCLARPSAPLKGEGDVSASESPSPLRGGVRGGGTLSKPKIGIWFGDET